MVVKGLTMMEPKHKGEAAECESDASSTTGTHELVGRHCWCAPEVLGMVKVGVGAAA